jgi:hypothetical protein
MKTCTLSLALAAVTIFSIPVHAQSAGETVMLQTIGVQGGALLYNTYCLVGAMHDGQVVNAWEKDFTVDILEEQIDLMDTLSGRYDNLLQAHVLQTDDSLAVAGLQECVQLLRNEASCLRDYVNDESEANGLLYDNARDRAWEKIKTLLGLGDAVVTSTGQLEESVNR